MTVCCCVHMFACLYVSFFLLCTLIVVFTTFPRFLFSSNMFLAQLHLILLFL